VEEITQLAQGNLRLKEWNHFREAIGLEKPFNEKYPTDEEFWFCIDEGQEIAFALEFSTLDRFQQCVVNSVAYMDNILAEEAKDKALLESIKAKVQGR
jgi:hypothetical protein